MLTNLFLLLLDYMLHIFTGKLPLLQEPLFRAGLNIKLNSCGHHTGDFLSALLQCDSSGNTAEGKVCGHACKYTAAISNQHLSPQPQPQQLLEVVVSPAATVSSKKKEDKEDEEDGTPCGTPFSLVYFEILGESVIFVKESLVDKGILLLVYVSCF